MVLMGNLAIRVPGKRLMWDGDQMKVTNDEEANRFIHNDYRRVGALTSSIFDRNLVGQIIQKIL